jgi:hypothetical protein
MMVTEADFRKASQAGIITPDQARQLWAVLSNQATSSRAVAGPQQSDSMKATGVRPTAAQQLQQETNMYSAAPQYGQPTRGNASQSPQYAAYNSSDYALQEDEALPPSRSGGGPKSGAQSQPQRKSSKPEWNTDFASCFPGDDDSSAPPPPKTTNITAAAKAKQMQQKIRPEWNNNVEELPPTRDSSEGDRRTPPAVKKSGVATSRRPQQEQPAGGLEEFMPSKQKAQPPTTKAPPPSLDDRPARPEATPKQQQAQASSRNPTAAAAVGSGAAQRGVALRQGGARGAGRQQQQEDVEPPPPQQNPDEVAEFLALKEQQRRAFEDALNEANQRESLVPCSLCGRTFRETVIDRHEGACRIANKKRRAYDVKGHRLEGIEGIDEVMVRPDPPPPPRTANSRGGGGAAAQQPKLPKWKVQHLQFQAFLKQGAGQPAEPPPDDRVACPHCNRKFAEETAARHIPKCANTVAKPKSLARPGRK